MFIYLENDLKTHYINNQKGGVTRAQNLIIKSKKDKLKYKSLKTFHPTGDHP